MNLCFIFCFPRSGSNWLNGLLNSHPQLAFAHGELQPFHDELFLEKAHRDPVDAAQRLRALMFDKNRKKIDDCSKHIQVLGNKSAMSEGAEPYMQLTFDLFPSARVIHLFRDPRDAMVSLQFSLWRWRIEQDKTTVEDLEDDLRYKQFVLGEDHGLSLMSDSEVLQRAEEWNTVNQAFVNGIKYAECKSQIQHISYSQLSQYPETNFQRILRWLGVCDDANLVQTLIKQNSFVMQTGRKPGQHNPLHKRRKGLIGDWEKYLSPKQNQCVLDITGKLFSRLNQIDLN